MDVDTPAAIDRLGGRIGALASSVAREMTSIRAEVSRLRAYLPAEFRDDLTENRRHSEILFETLRDDIRILAERFATITSKLDSLQR